MLESLIAKNESRTLEFKENAKSLISIIKAVVAFANTAGGNIVIGVKDKTKQIYGVSNILQEEERIASAVADAIEPLLIPDIRIQSFRNKELLVIHIPHMVGPYYIKSAGVEHGTYVRLGSTNRLADSETILSLQMLAKNLSFDELPCIGASIKDLDEQLIKSHFDIKFGQLNKSHYESLGILTRHHSKLYPTNGGILLFSPDRYRWFPDSQIVCVCFADKVGQHIFDQKDITSPLITAIDEVVAFIKRHTLSGAVIGEIKRKDTMQYPTRAIREAIINAIIHADYAKRGVTTQIAIYSNRMEMTNPGSLPYGQTLALALSGVSNMRNRMMGRIFREIKLIERLGTGLRRILEEYKDTSTKQPLFEELNTHFRVTLYSLTIKNEKLEDWQRQLLEKLTAVEQLSTSEIATLWQVTTRTARTRLKKMLELGLVNRLGTSQKDPKAVFKLG